MNARDILSTLGALCFVAFVLFLPLGVGFLLFLWLDPSGFWQTFAAAVLSMIVILILYFVEMFIAAVS